MTVVGRPSLPLLWGGLLCGALIVAGEAVLNGVLLREDWQAAWLRCQLPAPDARVALQGLLKLLLLGIVTMWLAEALVPRFGSLRRAAWGAGGVVWALVWAWVQWGMWLAGYVSPRVAMFTTVWGLGELLLAAWAGGVLMSWLVRDEGKECNDRGS